MSINQFRRFTYFFQTNNETAGAFLNRTAWTQALEQMRSDQILEVKLYHKERDYFFLIDTAPELTHTSLVAFLQAEIAFKKLQEALAENGLNPFWNKPLERIYELEQKVEYASTEGQLKTTIGAYKRVVWTLLLEEDPELIAAYKRVHGIGMAWPEITHNMKSVGVKDMEIYLHESQAILIMDTEPDFDLEKVGPTWQQLPREREWQAYVAKFQRTNPESSIQEKWQDMNEISFL